MKVLLAGDTHASRAAIQEVFSTAEDYDCGRIFQLGDLGFWPRDYTGSSFLEYIDKAIVDSGIELYALAGNHEDWSSLDLVFAKYLKDIDGFHKYGHIRLAPRTHVWTWGNICFASMSGAFSVDRAFRTKNVSWFPQEMPTDEDLAVLKELISLHPGQHVDVMLTHDAPVNLFQHQGKLHMVFRHSEAEETQRIHSDAILMVQPYLYVHGHWHQYYTYYYDTTYCVGLDQCSTRIPTVNMVILDTEQRTLSTLMFGENVIFELPEKEVT